MTFKGSVDFNEPVDLYIQLMNEIKASFHEQFPNGYCYVGMNKGLCENTIGLSIGLVGDIKDVTSQIRHNDPMYHTFLIFTVNGALSAELCHGSLKVKTTNRLYAMESVKTKFIKTKGDQTKILNMYKKWFAKLKAIVTEQGDNIYCAEQYKDYI